MANLILVRHTESVWNKKGIWTGLTDIPLSKKGRKEAKDVANLLKNMKLDIAYTSVLSRATETLGIIKNVLHLDSILIVGNKALNERDYGELTGKNKWEIKKLYGEQKFLNIRRGWDYPIPNGETLKDVYERVIPYYKREILPKLKMGKNVIIVAHGNSLRALVKYLENISDEDISKIEIATGEIYIYKLDKKANITSKQIKIYKPNFPNETKLQIHL
ncbi:MAG: 2,3-diphosphoglycerate-dependent phosphoglycerate mutase [Patescibacteria group bacterium]